MKEMKNFSLILLLFSCAFLNAQFDNYEIKNLEVNTEYSDFGVTYLGDSTAIYASTKVVENTIRRKKWKQNKQPYLELYSGDLTSEGEIENSINFSEELNSKYHESNVTFTKDGKTVYFSANNYNIDKKLKKAEEGQDKNWVLIQLYKATIKDNGEWTNITAMPFNNDNYQTGHPSLNKEENKLYFTSDMPNGYGETDIYVVDVLKRNDSVIYGKPHNLGGSINTSGKEMFPYISDSNKLYFSTDGHLNGYGGLDVHVSDLEATIIEDSKNIGRPINSNKDDFAFAYQAGKKTGHFSSNRTGGKGDDDIYFFEEITTEIEEPLICAQVAKGVVRDKVSGALLPQAVVTLYKDGEKIESVIVGNDAKFEFPVDCEANYKVVGEKSAYIPDNEEFITSDEADLELDLTLSLDTGCMQVVKGVVRDKVSGALLPKATVTLYKDGEKVESVIVSNDATFEFPVDCESNYKVIGEKRTYTPDQEEFITSSEANLELDLSLNLEDDFYLVGDRLLIKIDPIYFDLDKSFIRTDAAIELEKVIQVMRKYPGLVIEGGSHTDARGSKKYNEALSARRAKSTVDYIVSKGGINPSRIFSRGYGEYKPVNRCVDYTRCSEYEHQLNRRTEFVIMNPEILER